MVLFNAYPGIYGARLVLPKDLFNFEILPNPSLLNEMPKKNILFTATQYASKGGALPLDMTLRAELALEFFQKARQLGYDVVCVDGRSDGGWVSEVRDLGVKVETENFTDILGKHPMGKSRRQALNFALNCGKHPLVTWCEPEKHPYILSPDGRNPISMAATPVYEGLADLTAPRRVDNLESYPTTQQLAEVECNLLATNLLRMHASSRGMPQVPYLDHCSGPRTFHRDQAHYFTEYSGEIRGKEYDRWGSLLVPVWNMLIDGKKVCGVAVPYVHPIRQTEFEAGSPSYDAKRLEQALAFKQALDDLIESKKRCATTA